MKKYIDISAISLNELQSYLNIGYEVFETTKYVYENGEETLTYHVGYPLMTHYEELKEIVELYERYGLKEQLLNAVAESVGEKLEEYDTFGDGHKVKNELVTVLEKYDRVEKGKKGSSYYKKLSSDEVKEKYGF